MSQYPYRGEQPAWIDGRTADTDVRVREFIRSVYAWMFGGLAITTAAALWVLYSPAMQQIILRNRIVFFGLLIAEFALAMWVQVRITRMSASTAASAFLVYSLLNGLTLSVIFFVYTQSAIFQAFMSAAFMFAGMSLYGYMTKRSLTSMGSFLIMGFWGIFIGFLVNMWLQSNMLGFILSAIGVIVFLGLTAYYTQQLKSMALSTEHRENYAIVGALVLYISFINLFLMLLRLFGGGDRR
ncbi:MAG TPA: Bax inhibitor-1/YccA family protein [Thermoanaerobaculia bacterium]|nr:Bax inhibitor-1/YccA family protein [Thermoanaerobaculia bacterium]